MQCVFLDQILYHSWYVVWIMTWLIWDKNSDFCKPFKTSGPCLYRIKVNLRLLSWIYWGLDTLCVDFQYFLLPRLLGLNYSNWNSSIQGSLFSWVCWTINGIILMIKHLPGLPGNEISLNSAKSTLKMQKFESAPLVTGANACKCLFTHGLQFHGQSQHKKMSLNIWLNPVKF